MTDLVVFLAILAKSATGQKLSVYTSLVHGPRRGGELEGPEEFHLVLLDNGRIEQIAGPLREALSCLRCGACLNVCPVYRQIGGHAYGYTYPGPDRHSPDRDARRAGVGEGPRPRLVALRRVRGRLSGADRHSPHADRAAPRGGRATHRALAGARGLRRLRLAAATPCALPAVGADRAPAAAAVRARRPHPAAAACSSATGRARATCRSSRRAPSRSAGPSWSAGGDEPRPSSWGGSAPRWRRTPGLFPATPSVRPARPRERLDVLRRELSERWPESLARFRPRVRARGRRVPPRGPRRGGAGRHRGASRASVRCGRSCPGIPMPCGLDLAGPLSGRGLQVDARCRAGR